MSQVSKIDQALELYRRGIERHYGGRTIGKTLDESEVKQRILSIILEALPEKQKGSWCCHPDQADWHHIAPENKLTGHSECSLHELAGGSTGDASFNAALDEVSKALDRVFGVEG